MNQQYEKAINLVSELAERYRISALEPLLGSCRVAAAQKEISVAVLGRFKSGKSSFLNHLFHRDLLPVGVVPVTAVVTEIEYGPKEKAVVHFLDGRSEQTTVDAIRQFIAESENPDNVKGVSTVEVELPALESLHGLRFVDTPGLESALAHNTEASLRWLPNVGLALVTVGIDTPLSQHDIELLESLRQYTPNISVLLTKADLLNEAERAEVLSFVREQLARAGLDTSSILFYSVRPGYERFKALVEEKLLQKTLADFERQRRAIIERKLETLLDECADYLALALASAETLDSERDALGRQVVDEKEVMDEVKGEIRLVMRSETGGARARAQGRLDTHRTELEARLREALRAEFPNWTRSLEFALQSYETWLQRSLTEELLTISRIHRAEFLAPLEKVRRLVFRHLQSFRDHLSERTVRAFGVPLRTTEIELEIEEPRSPDIRIGKVFDRSWESLSTITPMWLVKGMVERRFRNRLAWMVEKNLSRLATQWADSVSAAGAAIEREAERRMDEFLATVTRLIASGADEGPQIRDDLARLGSARDEMRGAKSQEVAG